MFKAMIVDSDQLSADSIGRVIPWHRHGCRLVEACGSVASGRAAIRTHEPDILFTEIRAAPSEGLIMLASLISEYPEMQITVVTGGTGFRHSEVALRLGVCKILYKPVQTAVLEFALDDMVYRLKNKDFSARQEMETRGNAVGKFIVYQAVGHIKENCTGSLNLQDVADACYLSQWHLNKLLRRYTGHNFQDILNAARIEKAKKLMENPLLGIGDIAGMVGFADTSYLNRAFRKLAGCSPTDYRKAHIR